MKTIALRFSDSFAPNDGTIAEHLKIIDERGFVWYGKLGAKVSISIMSELLRCQEPKILLIQSAKAKRYWAYIQAVSYDNPPKLEIPEYYRDNSSLFSTWFKITKIIAAPKDVLAHCKVSSSNRPLSEVSRSSMSPYFIIEVEADYVTTK